MKTAMTRVSVELPERLVRVLKTRVGQTIGVLTIPALLALASFQTAWAGGASSSPLWFVGRVVAFYAIATLWAYVFGATLTAISSADRVEEGQAESAPAAHEGMVRFLGNPLGRVLVFLLPLGLIGATVAVSMYGGDAPTALAVVFVLLFAACYVVLGYAVMLAGRRLRR